MRDRWYYLALNPEPWAIGDLGVGRRNGKMYSYVSPNHQLKSFQEAVKECLEGEDRLPSGKYSLTFYFWRKQETYISTAGRRIQKSEVDATNMQKGLEDALQGILFDNDREVKDIRSVIVEQGGNVTPKILIRASEWVGLNPDEIPSIAWDLMDSQEPDSQQAEFKFENIEDVF